MSDKSATDPVNDELEAPLTPTTAAPVTERPKEGSKDLADFGDSLDDRDTEPNLDAQILRIALHAGLNK